MTLCFVRHGQTNYNRKGIMNDDPSIDVHLSDRGIEQVKKVAEDLRNTGLTHIYISQLPRTRQTADIINKYHDLELIQDPRINDNRSGFNGKHWIYVFFAYLFSRNRLSKHFADGESLLDSKKRVTEFLDELKKTHKSSDKILVVGHANTGQIIKGYANNLSDTKTFTAAVKNAQIYEYNL